MPDTSSLSTNTIADLVQRYGKQTIQLFAALAGATSLFYAVGFIIVNTHLLQLGVYESALISVGYVAPGVAFALIFMLSAAASAIVSATLFALLSPVRLRRILGWLPPSVRRATAGMSRSVRYLLAMALSVAAMVLDVVIIIAFSRLMGWVAWFGRNEATAVSEWCLSVAVVVAGLLYAEHLLLLWHAFRQLADQPANLLASAQARFKSAAFVALAAGLIFLSVLGYGQVVYGQIPSVFGGGQPIVVRFYGADVNKLDRLGINLEPGETNLTERIELIAQTEDRYIVRVADRAISFDKEFVQGIRYEPPEFFLDPEFFLTKHTRQGELYLADEAYDEALSEFNLVLQRSVEYVPALQGRIRVALIEKRLDLDLADTDYRVLRRVDQNNPENFYGYAKVQVLRSQALNEPIDVADVVSALQQAQTISPTLIERARSDAAFVPLRLDARFYEPVYGSGPAAARWFRSDAQARQSEGATDKAIADLQSALAYVEKNEGQPDALSMTEIADLHTALSELYGSTTEQALAELQAAVDATDQKDPTYLNRLADALVVRGDIDRALETYERVLNLSTADDPNRRQALIGQGRAALEAGRYVPARAAFEQALTLASFDASTLYDYARTLAALDDVETETALRDAITLDLSLAERAQKDDWQKYFSNAGTAVANLVNGAVFVQQARLARDQGNLALAIQQYQQATQIDPSVPHYWSELGDVLYRSELYADAAVAYQNALQYIGSPDAALLIALGRARFAANDAAGAIEALTNAIGAQGSTATAETYVLLAGAYESAQQYDQAAAAYAEAAQRDRLNIVYPYRRGIDLILADRREDGLAALDRTITQGGLQVTSSTAVSLRDAPADDGMVLSTLSVGALLKITAAPQVIQRQVWWPVTDQNNVAGWVNAADVAPAEQVIPPVIQSGTP